VGLDDAQHFIRGIALGDAPEVEEQVFVFYNYGLLFQKDVEFSPACRIAGSLEARGIRQRIFSLRPSPELGKSPKSGIEGSFGGFCDTVCMGENCRKGTGDWNGFINRPPA